MLEPEAFNNVLKICAMGGTDNNNDLNTNALFYIAISLKRIADVICNPPMVCPPDLETMEEMSSITPIMKGVK